MKIDSVDLAAAVGLLSTLIGAAWLGGLAAALIVVGVALVLGAGLVAWKRGQP